MAKPRDYLEFQAVKRSRAARAKKRAAEMEIARKRNRGRRSPLPYPEGHQSIDTYRAERIRKQSRDDYAMLAARTEYQADSGVKRINVRRSA